MEKTNQKMKQFTLNSNSAYFISNRNKIFHWGESILNFKSFNKNKDYNEAVDGLKKTLKKNKKKSLNKYLSGHKKNPMSRSCTNLPKTDSGPSIFVSNKNRRSYPTIDDLSEIHDEEEKDLLNLASCRVPREII